jgi:intraflagellar transport protein 140
MLLDPRHGTVPGNKDLIRCVAFNPRKRVLAGGTHAGRIVMWRYTGGATPSEDDWEILPAIKLNVSIHRITWGPGDSLMAISSAETKSLSILNETILTAKTTANGNTVIQTSADRFNVTNAQGRLKQVAAGIRIKGMDLDAAGKYVLIYNGKRAEIREIKDGRAFLLVVSFLLLLLTPNACDSMRVVSDIRALAPLSQFMTRAKCAAVYHETVYAAVGARIEVLNFQGVVKKILTFSESEGIPVVIDIWSDFLACATSVGVVKLWNIKRAEPVQVVPGRLFEELGVIKSIRVNCNGTKISMLCNRQDGMFAAVFADLSRPL